MAVSPTLMISAFIQQASDKISLPPASLSLVGLRVGIILHQRKKLLRTTMRPQRTPLCCPHPTESRTETQMANYTNMMIAQDTIRGMWIIVTTSRRKLPKEVTVIITQTWE
jgi:hypothetical protein